MEGSLARLDTDYIDLYYQHRVRQDGPHRRCHGNTDRTHYRG
ncbi:hypothetical protein [Arthrobacter sp. TS-15]|nr:hypothetical protein [Arthrobacter sp. TS-15]